MNFFSRLWNWVAGKGDKLLDKIEDPTEQLGVFTRQMNSQLENLQTSVAAAIADEKRLKLDVDAHLGRAQDWERKAILALEAGDENLAKEALTRKEHSEAQALQTQKTWEAQKQASEKLKASLSATRTRIDEAKRTYTLAVARYKTAETQKKVSQTLSHTTQNGAVQMIDRLNDKILRLEAEAETSFELNQTGQGDDIDGKFLALERNKKGQAALEELKRKVLEHKPAEKMAAGAENVPIQELKKKLR